MFKVSIIVPSYNHSMFLKGRLESIYNQTFNDFEVILLDDCSADDSKSILKEYANHPKTSYCVFNDKNSGSPFKQWGKGLALAKGEFVWIAESDDLASLNFLEQLLPLIETNKNAGIVYCASIAIDENGNTTHYLGKPTIESKDKQITYNGLDFINKYMLSGNSIDNVSACLFRRSCFDGISLKTINLSLSGDYLIYKMILSKSDIIFYNNTLNKFRFHTHNIRTKIALNGEHTIWIEALEVQKILMVQEFLPIELVSKAVNTPLIHCIDLWFRLNKDINLRLLNYYIKLFNKSWVKLLYGYLFNYKI